MVRDALVGRDARVYLFGSAATGALRASSDIDVAIEAPEPLPAALLSRLREALEESTIPYEVDVVDLGTVDPEFRQRVKREGILWSA